MSEIFHELDAADAAAMIEMRAALAANHGPMTRALFDQIGERVPDAAGVSYAPGSVGGVSGVWCRPAHARAGAVLLYFHGGVYMLGSAHAFRHFVGQIAARAGVAAFAVDYRLAPEHRFPAAVEDALAVYRAVDADTIALAGDSAGGGLALVLLAEAQARARQGLGRAPVAAVVISPWTDLALTGESLETRAHEDPVLTRGVLAAGASQYLNGRDPRDPLASPLYGPLGDLPPIQAHVGTAEILLDDARRLVTTAGAELHVWEGMPHVFLRNVATLSAARAALDLAGGFLRAKIG